MSTEFYNQTILSENLQKETEQLQNAWNRHSKSFLSSYLIRDVEDPRINIQSVLTCHFLLKELFGSRYDYIMEHEIRFAITANWLLGKLKSPISADEINNDMNDILCSLLEEADLPESNVPLFLKDSFKKLAFPNYIGDLLSYVPQIDSKQEIPHYLLNTFMQVWSEILEREEAKPISVIEPACGSANDYRFLDKSGVAPFLDYTGVDICQKNIANANELFPNAVFKIGNVFQIQSADNAYDIAFVHDLFEHLSLEGFERAIMEICRVTSQKICFHFFNMSPIPHHRIKPIDNYYRNTLSVEQIQGLIKPFSKSIEVIHIDSFLANQYKYFSTHNKNAYTWIVELNNK